MAVTTDASPIPNLTDWNDLPKIGIGWEISLRHGWGVHGYHLAKRLIEKRTAAPMLLHTDRELTAQELAPLSVPISVPWPKAFPIIHAWGVGQRPTYTVGDGIIPVFETNPSPDDYAYLKNFGWRVLALSRWNAEMLMANGVSAQYEPLGVDTTLFRPAKLGQRFGADRFVIFSGGKAELRKGQDIVLAAFKIFAKRHPEALLVTMWNNPWPETSKSLSLSPYTEGAPSLHTPNRATAINWVRNHILPEQHEELGEMSRAALAGVLQSCNVALFPNRCEGGTNMVAMECLAAGVPTILSNGHGHKDLIDFPVPCFKLDHAKPCNFPMANEHWVESDVEEIVEGLQYLYDHLGEGSTVGRNAATTMETSWDWSVRIDAQSTALRIGMDNSTLDAAMQATHATLENEDRVKRAREFASLAAQRRNAGHHQAAVAIARRAAAMAPKDLPVKSQLGNLLLSGHRPNAALGIFKDIRKERDEAITAHNLGLAYLYLGQTDNALKEFSRFAGDSLDCAHDLAHALLLAGKWDDGMKAIEIRRLKHPEQYQKKSMPEWQGEPCETLWVTCEQGIGDAFMFARFLPLARAACKRLILSTHAQLMAMFTGYPGVDELWMLDPLMPEPKADFHVPLMSLAHYYEARPEKLPPDPGHFKEVAQRLAGTSLSAAEGALKIGIVWAGAPIHTRDNERSLPLEALLPLVELPDVQLFSLQCGERAKDLERVGVHEVVANLAPQLVAWPITAAVLSKLDALVTCDTSVAHLAAAIGVPTLMLLCKFPDWRWLLKRNDTPWYPSVRLYRQSRLGVWDEPVAEATRQIARLARKG